MSDELNVSFRPKLRNPVLVAAFRGWNDGGQGASLAAGYLAKAWEAERFAEIDSEQFYDFQVTRPMVSLEDGTTRRLEWPDNGFFHATVPGTGRDAVILIGTEPNLRWRTFAGLVLGLPEDLAVQRVVTFGPLLADVPHMHVDTGDLETAADEYSEQVSEAVSTDADTAAYVEELERRVDLLSAEEELPSGDSLAAELTRFLRERDEQEERDDGPD